MLACASHETGGPPAGGSGGSPGSGGGRAPGAIKMAELITGEIRAHNGPLAAYLK